MKDVVITIKDAEKVSHNIADLLCWWQGFNTAMKMNDEYFNPIALNGIDEVRELNILIKDKLREL